MFPGNLIFFKSLKNRIWCESGILKCLYANFYQAGFRFLFFVLENGNCFADKEVKTEENGRKGNHRNFPENRGVWVRGTKPAEEPYKIFMTIGLTVPKLCVYRRTNRWMDWHCTDHIIIMMIKITDAFIPNVSKSYGRKSSHFPI